MRSKQGAGTGSKPAWELFEGSLSLSLGIWTALQDSQCLGHPLKTGKIQRTRMYKTPVLGLESSVVDSHSGRMQPSVSSQLDLRENDFRWLRITLATKSRQAVRVKS